MNNWKNGLAHMDYAAEVFRFGGRTPRIDREGRSRNLDHRITFDPADMTTDGRGNVLDHPVLTRKPCIGRPEAYLRNAVHDRRTFVDRNSNEHPVYNQCDKCPVILACEKLCLERIESCPEVDSAYGHFDSLARGVSGTPFLHSQPVRAWAHFLHALKAHGGWTSVNDARVSAAEIVKKQERDAARRLSSKQSRQEQAAARKGCPPPLLATKDFLSALEQEYDRRLAVLLDLRARIDSPRWINRLFTVGCTRTAEVWRAGAILSRTGHGATGNSIAKFLLLNSRVEVKPIRSLTTVACRDLLRIQKLESDAAGLAIWAPFDPGC